MISDSSRLRVLARLPVGAPPTRAMGRKKSGESSTVRSADSSPAASPSRPERQQNPPHNDNDNDVHRRSTASVDEEGSDDELATPSIASSSTKPAPPAVAPRVKASPTMSPKKETTTRGVPRSEFYHDYEMTTAEVRVAMLSYCLLSICYPTRKCCHAVVLCRHVIQQGRWVGDADDRRRVWL